MKKFSFKNLSLRYKISFAYSFAVALIFAVGGAILFSVMKHNIETGIENELKNTTSALMNMVKTSADVSVKNYLRGIAEKNQDIVQNFYSQFQQGKLTEQEAKSKAVEILFSQTVGKTGYIYCVDSHGIAIVHPKPGVAGKNFLHFEFVKEQIRRKEGYLEYIWKNPGETLERPKALYMAYFEEWDWIISVSSYREEFRDMVNVNDFRENIVSHRFGKTGYSFIVGYDGVSLIHPYKQIEGKNFSDEKDARGRRFIAEMCMKKNGRIIYPWKNPGEVSAREKITVFNDIPQFGWIVGSSVYLDELYEPLNTFRNLILMICFIAVFVVFPVISMRISSYITGSLKLLMKKLALVSDRDFSVRMKICSEDEIGQMAGYFNNFMEQLEISAKKLSESEKKYRDIFENAVEGIFQSVPGGGYLSVNSAYAKIFGYDSPQEVLSSVSDVGKQMYVNPEDREKLVEIIKENGMVEGFEAQLYRKDRSIMWVSVYARSVSDNQGNLLYYEGSFIDITDRKKAELELKEHQEHLEEMVEKRTSALRESERKLYDIIDFLPDAIAVIDKDSKVIAWNRVIEKMTGVKAEDILGKGNYEYAIPFYGERRPILIDLAAIPDDEFEKKYPKISRQDGVLFGESFTPNLPGGGAYLLATASALYDSRGNFTGAIELIRDITDRKKAEDELRQTKEYLENVIENSPDCISISDRQGKVFKWNRMASELSGYSFDEIRKISVYDVYADRDEFEAVKKKLREQGVVSRHEIKMKRKDGAVFPVEASIAVLKDEHRKPVATIAIVSDLSEIKKALTETRIAREAAEQANKKITDSLNYAKMIQQSLLANLDVVKSYIPNSFFIWEPRDIVGGDIFFTEKLEDGFIVAVADCTGHGVPGAFMTMIAVSALRRIIKDEGCHDPAEILRRLNIIVKTTLHQDKVYALSDDGMDVGIVRMENVSIESHAFGFQSSDLIFAGAKIPLYYVRRGEINVIKGDRESIGYRRSDVNFSFTTYRIHIEKGMNFYMASDGFTDQMGGGEKRRRFGTARFRHLLKEISGEPFEKQRSMLIQVVEEHRGDNDRQDDMTVAGFGF